MNLKRLAILSASFLVLFVGASFTLNHIGDDKETLMLNTMLESFQSYHFHPLELDDEFSSELYETFLERMDSRKRFFIASDIEKLEPYRFQLDEAMKENPNHEFFNLTVELLEAGISRAKTYYEQALDSDFDLAKGGTIELDGKKSKYPEDELAQALLWKDIMKYEVISRLYRAKEEQRKQLEKPEEERKEDFTERTDAEMIADAKEDIRKLFDKWFIRLEQTTREDRLDNYLNVIASLHDPHTNYFAPIEKENFDIGMSGKLEGIGARLQSDGEETKVTEIVTGGPAWKEGSLKANDLIIKVAQGDEEPVVVSGMDINKVVSYIRGKKGTEVRLHVRDTEGEEKIISIIRDVVIMEEGYAKSLILNYGNEGISNIGYIDLPRFYADFKDDKGRQCANDIATEIQKLQAQGVENIILDLRDNGGGSLRDVVDMAGLFIEEGPIVQVKPREMKPRILEDTDSRVLFKGNLIIMVNQFSASASEILAAAMQDYDRAVIIGSRSTFGKGTVQRFVDLDRMVRGKKEEKPLGSVKITIQKFYRIDGGSTQLKGVVPDIILPDSYQEIDLGEKEYEHAMAWSSIDPVEYQQDIRKVSNMDELVANSEKRISQNPTFQLIGEDAKRLKASRDDSDYSLNYEEYVAERRAEKAASKKFDGIMKEDIEGLEVLNPKADIARIEADESKKARNEKWLKGVRKDVYIQEALMVMKDMMKR